MTNVLPHNELLRMAQRARAKFVLTGALVCAAAALAGIVALSPAFFVVYFSRAASTEVSGAVAQDQELQRKTDREAAGRVRVLLQEIAFVTKKHMSASDAIAGAYSLRPTGVTIGGVAYSEGEPGTITLVGSAKTRDDVSAFRDALARDTRFEHVSVPVAALVGALEGNFTITLTGKF